MTKVQAIAVKEKAAMEARKQPQLISMPTALANKIMEYPLTSHKKKARFMSNATYLGLAKKRKAPTSSILLRTVIDVEEMVRVEEANARERQQMVAQNMLNNPIGGNMGDNN